MNATIPAPLSEGPVRLELLDGGAIWHVRLATPRANVLDRAMVTSLTRVFSAAARDPRLKAVIIEGEGPHFSFGASVAEHLPGRFETMLEGFHGLFFEMLESATVTLSAVRGQCLGGGLELASFCHRVFASPDARLGQPEVSLGVFAPVASAILCGRIGRAHAEDLLLSGRVVPAEEAARMGLVDELALDPLAAALEYARRHFLPKSASSLRIACRAARASFAEAFRADLARLERLYSEHLMRTADAIEGLTAFLEKRDPRWSDR